jgi:hypothetical protein
VSYLNAQPLISDSVAGGSDVPFNDIGHSTPGITHINDTGTFAVVADGVYLVSVNIKYSNGEDNGEAAVIQVAVNGVADPRSPAVTLGVGVGTAFLQAVLVLTADQIISVHNAGVGTLTMMADDVVDASISIVKLD